VQQHLRGKLLLQHLLQLWLLLLHMLACTDWRPLVLLMVTHVLPDKMHVQLLQPLQLKLRVDWLSRLLSLCFCVQTWQLSLWRQPCCPLQSRPWLQ
jgi:hypothetical protein